MNNKYREGVNILRDILNWSIDELHMTPRLHNLMYPKIKTIDDFLRLTDEEVLSWKMFGKSNFNEFNQVKEEILDYIETELVVSLIPTPGDILS